MRPIIGITSRPRTIASNGEPLDVHAVEVVYVRSVTDAGGLPILLVPGDAGSLDAAISAIDGLVLSGGGDVDPARYGSDPNVTNYEVDAARDEFEISLVREAERRLLPTLAICRGLQVVNVAFGGTLIGDLAADRGIEGHRQIGSDMGRRHQMVTLTDTCRVARITGATSFEVNSIHHQAVDVVGAGLEIVGTSDDGVVEAIEWILSEWPMSAVQWHPEFLTAAGDGSSLALFRQLVVDAAARHKSTA